MRDAHLDQFVFDGAVLIGLSTETVTTQGVLILLLTANGHFFGRVFGAITHVNLVVNVRKSIRGYAVLCDKKLCHNQVSEVEKRLTPLDKYAIKIICTNKTQPVRLNR